MTYRLNENKSRKSLLFKDWPAPDQRAWDAAFQKGGLWEPSGLAANWSKAHRERTAWGYGRWLTYLTSCGQLDSGNPGVRVRPERLDDYIRELKCTVGSRAVANYINHLTNALRVMCFDQHLGWLKAINATLKRQIRPTIHKRPRLRDAGDLYELGMSMMDSLDDLESPPTLQQAAHYRDGLLIAFSALRPLRRRTLECIEVGENLVQMDNHWWLVFSGKDMKTGHPLEFEWPQALETRLEIYRNRFRPKFKNSNKHNYLWASKNGRPLGGQGLSDRFIRHTKRAFGKSISIHLFRDCVATTIAIRDPEHIGIAKLLLGHNRLDTTHQYYIQAGAIEASRSHTTAIQQLRNQFSEAHTEEK